MPAFPFYEVHPELAVLWLSGGIRRIIIAPVFVFAGCEATVTCRASRDIYEHSLSDHSIHPLHFSTSIRQEFGACPQAFLEMKRWGVNRLIHPPLSGDSPGVPVGS